MKKRLSAAAAVIVMLCLFTATGCGLPSYSVSLTGTSEEAMEEFMNALAEGDDIRLDELVYNCTWKPADSGTLDSMSKGDRMVAERLRTDRKWKIAGSEHETGSGSETLTVELTTFDISKFRAKLTENVLARVKAMQNEGESFEGDEGLQAVSAITEEEKQRLVSSGEDFATSATFEVGMVLVDGRWRIILSDEFYSALSGYAV